MVEFFDRDEQVLRSIETFLRAGLTDQSSLIVIAARSRLDALQARMGHLLTFARRDERYFAAPAEEMLGRFMVDGWPDRARFHDAMGPLVEKARGPMQRPVRAYGEMVALLAAQGNTEAALRLEHLWNEFLAPRSIVLLCAYPRSIFSAQSEDLRTLSEAHSHVI